MTDTTEYTIGAEVACSDGVCGELSRVVIDPVARTLTHLVVEPTRPRGVGRLVPVDLVDPGAREIRLRCTLDEFQALEDAEETHFLAQGGEELGYGAGEVFAWPYYGLGTGFGLGSSGAGLGGPAQFVIEDRVPVGDVEVRRGEPVHATDGDIGRVQGLVVDPRDHHVTHMLLDEGHLWGKREITIPISAVTGVGPDGVRLKLTRDEVRDLPPTDLAHDA
jgi:sporulation protein YlmC with PRC-barrel domain